MKVTQKKREGDIVKLDVVATEKEVNNALNMAQVTYAQAMGLRPEQGKTPAQAAKEQLGVQDLDAVVEQTAVESLSLFAIDKKNIIPAVPPRTQAKSPFHRGRYFEFSVEVTLKPEYELTSYDPVEITVQPFKLDDEMVEKEIDRQIEGMSQGYMEFEKAEDKPLEKGDSCLIAMKCIQDGEELKNLTTDGRPYTVGEGLMPDGFDEALYGMQPGETKEFTFDAPDFDENFNEITKSVDCTVTLKEIQKMVEPVIDDEWVRKNIPLYKSLDEFRSTIARGLEQQQREQYDAYLMQMAAGELGKRFEGKIADEAYESMRSNIVNTLRMQVQQQGKSWEDFINENGGEQQFGIMLMMQARQNLVQGFSLDAVFRHEGLSITDSDIDDACHSMNPQVNTKEMRQQMEQSGRGFALREAAERYRANKWVLDHAIVHEAEQA